MTWILAILSLLGTYLNVKKNRLGFLLWGFTNFGWVIFNIASSASLRKNGLLSEASTAESQAALMGVYFLMAVWGWFSWGRKPEKAEAAVR